MNEQELNELDAWIAVNVFGLKLNANGMIETWPRKDVRHDLCVPRYTRNKAQAFEVLERCGKKCGLITLSFSYPDCVRIISEKNEVTISETLETAICLFARNIFK